MTLETAVRESVLCTRVRSWATKTRRAVRHSRVRSLTLRWLEGLERAGGHSRMASIGSTLEPVLHHSRLYRWLTADPEPDVLEINLRETKTVGPIIRTTQRLGTWLSHSIGATPLPTVSHRLHQWVRARPLQPGGLVLGLLAVVSFGAGIATDSAQLVGLATFLGVVALLLSRIRWSEERLRTSRAVQALTRVFVPPDRPDSGSNRETMHESPPPDPADDRNGDSSDDQTVSAGKRRPR